MPFELRAPPAGEAGLRRELYFLSMFRVLESGLLAFVVFSPLAMSLVTLRNAAWAFNASIAFLVLGSALFLLARNPRWPLRELVAAGIALDLLVFAVLLHNLIGFSSGIALMLLFNVGASAMLLSLRWSLTIAAIAALLQFGDYAYTQLALQETRPLPEAVMFGVSYLATAMLTNLLGRQLREVEVLAEQRGAEVDNLARVNEMIIRRMRTGLLAVDAENTIRLFNESAWYLLGNPSPERRALADVAPELSRRLWRWRQQQ
ncbi:MAG TPA: PAS domain-containing sensor histidine kinase, partial [Xanthomonadaceae bacterium]|nr:PAS domain-containing sensor histidine kinase [Xanthomonadaceae bacterium]